MSRDSGDAQRRPPRSVLITGAAGYIGRLLTASLARDRRGLSRIVASDVREVPGARRLEGVEYLVSDIRDPGLAPQLTGHGVDTVVHLAAVVTPRPGDTREFLYSVDVEGTRNVLRACVAAGVRKLIITSSGAAYGYHPDNARMLAEGDPLRGNEEFAYAHHKRLVEQLLADYRQRHPELQQLIFRVGTILGESVSNQITALFEKRFVLGLSGVATPFVFIWDGDVVACLEAGIFGDGSGIYNLAGDGAPTLREIAARLDKPYLELPEKWVTRALSLLQRLRLTRYGPEQVGFLRHRPVLNNARLKAEFGYRPRYTSREVFEIYRRARQAAGAGGAQAGVT
jgi:UDP-glucose 4-epimerase